jgi:hypothetical protein
MPTRRDRVSRFGIPIVEADVGRHDEPDVIGLADLEVHDGRVEACAVVRPGISEQDLARFTEWLDSRVDRFAEHGPEPDGWEERSDGRWLLWLRNMALPAFDEPGVGAVPPVMYASVVELRDAAITAGLPCRGWTQDNEAELAAESGTCADGVTVAVYPDDTTLAVALVYELSLRLATQTVGIATFPLLVGPNWIIATLQAPELAQHLGGIVLLS